MHIKLPKIIENHNITHNPKENTIYEYKHTHKKTPYKIIQYKSVP